MVFSFGVNTLTSDATPPNKKIIKAKSPTTVEVAPPCTVALTLGPVLDYYPCPGSNTVLYYTVAGTCTKTGSNCDLVYVAVRDCVKANFAANKKAAKEEAATQCPQ